MLFNKYEQETDMMQGKGTGKTLAGKEQSHWSPAQYYSSEKLGWLVPCTVSDLPFLWMQGGQNFALRTALQVFLHAPFIS